MTHNVGEFQGLMKEYLFGHQSEYSFVLNLITGAPHDSYEYAGMDLFEKAVHLQLATPLFYRTSTVCSTRLAKRQEGEWNGYAKSLMHRIGVEDEIPDEAFTYGRTGALRDWYLPSFGTKTYECWCSRQEDPSQA